MKTGLLAAAAALALSGFVTTAHAAGANRVWVSGHGVDQASCGAPASPCRSLQYAHDSAVAAGGEIDILDPAGYGAVTITKALSIVNDGVGTAGVQATSGAAIIVDAGPGDAVYLKGLNVDGVAQSAATGIYFHAAGSLTVVNCVVRHFSGSGIVIEPVAGDAHVLIDNTIASENGQAGIVSQPLGASGSVTGVIDRVTASSDAVGIHLLGGSAAAVSTFTVSHSDASGNAQDGLDTGASGNTSSSVNVDSSSFSNNGGDGMFAGSAVVVRISRSIFDANPNYGVVNSSPGVVYSAGDNHMDGNGSGKVLGPSLAPDGFN